MSSGRPPSSVTQHVRTEEVALRLLYEAFLSVFHSAMAGPRPVVLSGPSGAGKSTLLKKLMKEYNNVFGFSVSRKWATQHTHLITQLEAAGAHQAHVN